MSFVGIVNEQEFYSQHFLDEVFMTSDAVKAAVKAYEDRETESKGDDGKAVYRAPWRVLASKARESRLMLQSLAETADPEERYRAEREFIRGMLRLFDLPADCTEPYFVTDSLELPLIGEKRTADGKPYLQVFAATALGGVEPGKKGEAREDAGTDTDPLQLCVANEQRRFTGALTGEGKHFEHRNWQTLLEVVFEQTRAPRWVILATPSQWLLIDRVKFAQRRLLRFNWDTLFERHEESELKAAMVLLTNDSFTVKDGECALESLDEDSHKHAYGVSQDLKYALRECIELLGNEAARQLQEIARKEKKGFLTGKDGLTAKELSDECLRWMYRLLFLFFVESRPDLKYVPIDAEDETYLKGYSLEGLRDLELIPLTTKQEREGSYLHESIDRLFRFFSQGTKADLTDELVDSQASASAFEIEPLQSTLFDDSRLPLLKQVVFPNELLQKVICLMSLSRPVDSKGRRQRRGRISYAHLSLNQLGAVYEALLSYSGFFAKTDLYEVKETKDKTVNELKAAYFVPEAELDKYSEDEKVFDRDPVTKELMLRKYPKGTFIYRMAGRERENSASYYTPEVLTHCVVKEALDVLIKQQLDGLPDDKSKSEKILSWRICEPAMGSAAFLNEGINQVAELYMHYAQKVPDAKALTQTEYRHELQRVRMFLADRNIYGVDLNPVAVELAEVSLWLNAMSDDRYVPWFGLQLACGNSLIGCRREAYWRKNLVGKAFKTALPHVVGNRPLQEGEIWHFLVPNTGMSFYAEPTVKSLEKEAFKKFSAWRERFTSQLTEAELDELEKTSQLADKLWWRWAKSLAKLNDQTTDDYPIYGYEPEGKGKLAYAQKNSLVEKIRYGDSSFGSGEYDRLKLAMDYWCSLWFWPLHQADLLPKREDFIKQMQAVLNGVKLETGETLQTESFQLTNGNAQRELFGEPDFNADELKEQQEGDLQERRRQLFKRYPQLEVAFNIAQRLRFLHWPLQFADVFMPPEGEHAGFDLTLGNPPWRGVQWDARGILGEADPVYVLHAKDYSAKGINDVVIGKRDVVDGKTFFERFPEDYADWLTEYETVDGTKRFFQASANYQELKGSAPNLFKMFLPLVWKNAAQNGVQGLLHPETVLTETNGDTLRLSLYPRLRKHYQFANELKLFPEVHHETEFSVNIYGNSLEAPDFESMNNLYVPKTIELSRQKTDKPIEGKKTEDGRWNTAGHPDRVLHYGKKEFELLAKVFSTSPTTPVLPTIQAVPLLEVLEKFGEQPLHLSNFDERQEVCVAGIWHETGAKINGTMKELPGNQTTFPGSPEQAIYNGPHISVGTSMFKTPNQTCAQNSDWSVVDLTYIPDDYLPRVKYLPNVDREMYLSRMPKVPWSEKVDGNDVQRPVTDYYRLALRSMVSSDLERTLVSGILACAIAHANILESVTFKDMGSLVQTAGVFHSLLGDFFVRQQNKANLLPALLMTIPIPSFSPKALIGLSVRTLSLNCLTSWHKKLWEESWKEPFQKECWATKDNQINRAFFSSLTPEWKRSCALRSDLERRQALLEIDVIVAQAFGLTLNELLVCYRLGFRVMRGYDQNTWYDQNGRIVSTTNSQGLRGVGLPSRPSADEKYAVNGVVRQNGVLFEEVRDMQQGTVTRTFMDDTLPGGSKERTITYVAPFFKKNREEDYAEAWAYFEKAHKEQEKA